MSTPSLRRLSNRPNVREAIQDEIVRYITENALLPGARLPSEGSIARLLGVGRNSVREAIISLRTLGVIDVQPGSGLSVRGLDFVPVHDYFSLVAAVDYESIKHIRELRMYIELGLADTLVARRTPAQLKRIKSVLKRFEAVAATGGYRIELDRAFHEAVWERVDNPVLARVLGIFWDVVEQAHASDVLLPPRNPVEHAGIHHSIYQALARGDADELRKAISTLFYDPESQPALNPSPNNFTPTRAGGASIPAAARPRRVQRRERGYRVLKQ